MIRHFTHVFSDLAALRAEVANGDMARAARGARSILVQVYCASGSPEHICGITGLLAKLLPTATVVGATTVGEIAAGRLLTNQTIIGFSFFESSRLHAIALPCTRGGESGTGAALGRRIRVSASDIAGVLLLATPLSIDLDPLFAALEPEVGDFPLFGGGAGDYTRMLNTCVFADGEIMDAGIVAVVFASTQLALQCEAYLGWIPVSHPMTVTRTDGPFVKEIDGRPAFDIYRRYLGARRDDSFYMAALEFPLLVERDGQWVARVPVAACEDDSLQFLGDIATGEVVHIGYGDAGTIIEHAGEVQAASAAFAPNVVFMYSCGCRRFLLQEDVERESLPFEALAPTFGFFTYGEFFADGPPPGMQASPGGARRLHLLNSALVAVGLREGEPAPAAESAAQRPGRTAPAPDDPYDSQHTRVISKLLHFIKAVTSELEATNRELERRSVTDTLTQLANRIRLDESLEAQLAAAIRSGTPFSVVLLDIDHFKHVNDTCGHLAGDRVLVAIAQVLKTHIRGTDGVGRWGGEEFLVVCPDTGIAQAAQLAERLRQAIARQAIPEVGHCTASLGVAAYRPGDDAPSLIARADRALYEAKDAGRNRVGRA
ncbi:hypothetical protein BN940_09321 [Castellaniella defragrans 65Phen]|jgi:diguanylate cyclase (GGDEF)-like protein|uniref:diguanylate cyclase n=1 Tax=Castellaniella defragrans (strain DSM 12143 / CCUG 39792 / 65Phen) TaxID=1437824 RepID=W8X973_CASD6|nr:diguanylate cyclase [Castellaniella defragrans]CDM24325.1 hypothetical protein BN940_09321 [Castellaniella defragrans 65Phen]